MTNSSNPPDPGQRLARVGSAIAQIEHAKSRADVVATLEAVFALYGSTHWLVTGLPLPGQSLAPLVIAQHWTEARTGAAYRPSAEDLCLQKALDWHSVFILREGFWAQSPLALAAGLREPGRDARDLLIVPIDPFYRMQGVAILTFVKDDQLHSEIAMNNLSYADRSLLKAAVTAAFLRLHTLEEIGGHRKGELTLREAETVSWCALGLTAAQIAHRMDISERTVVSHIQNASLKLQANNRTECVVQAIRYNQIGVGTHGRRGFFELRTEVLDRGPYASDQVFR